MNFPFFFQLFISYFLPTIKEDMAFLHAIYLFKFIET